jgi:hypothetical protein
MPHHHSSHPASYRDPSGFVFEKDGIIYRQVNKVYQPHFDQLIQGGLYEALTSQQLLIRHDEVENIQTSDPNAYKVIMPERIGYVSYPCEWSFDMLKAAALLTLRVLKEALRFDMILKDASPYNIQWHRGQFIFIDTLSFEKYEPKPWFAYRQYCENFLGPLLVMHYRKMPMQQWQLAYPDGMPLALVKKLLPGRSKFSLHTYLHIHLHGKMAPRKITAKEQSVAFPKEKLLKLITSLEELTGRLTPGVAASTWSDYYEEAGNRNQYLPEKKRIVEEWLQKLPAGQTVVDIGANTGEFSFIAAKRFSHVIATDFDPLCINELYKMITQQGEKNILPLIIDIVNPTPATGFNNAERASFIDRSKADIALALAVIHHLAIGKNVPLHLIASFFDKIAKTLIIEFVPKDDEKVVEMLAGKKDIYDKYNETEFLNAFGQYYKNAGRKEVAGSKRVLFFLEKIQL